MKIVLKQNQNIFFSSDLHLNHKNICSATTEWNREGGNNTRDFESLEQMNDTIINNINAVVGEDDILVLTGDFSFGGHHNIPIFRKLINCKNIIYILGNHDEHIQKNTNNYRELFLSVHHYLELTVVKGDQKFNFVLFHYPIASWNNLSKNWYHLHGHVHFNSEIKEGPGRMLDIGVDGNNYHVYSLENIISILSKKERKSLFDKDHHV